MGDESHFLPPTQALSEGFQKKIQRRARSDVPPGNINRNASAPVCLDDNYLYNGPPSWPDVFRNGTNPSTPNLSIHFLELYNPPQDIISTQSLIH